MAIFENPTMVNWDNMSSAGDFLMKANASANDWLFTSIDVLVIGILFVSLTIGFGWESALLVSSFIGFMLSVLFLYMGLVSYTVVGFFVGAIILTIMYIIWSSRYD